MNLFGSGIISSISFDQEELLSNIMMLYAPSGFECDVTFNKGGFYKGRIPRPKHCFDLLPRDRRTIKADYRKLPAAVDEYNSIIWDPPFICGTNVNSEPYIMAAKYSSYKNISDLQVDYNAAIIEFSRVLKKNGILIVKCQDTVHGRRNYFNHILVHDLCIKNQFKPLDLFILLAKNRFSSLVNQNHARKFHSYFWVFKKVSKKTKHEPSN